MPSSSKGKRRARGLDIKGLKFQPYRKDPTKFYLFNRDPWVGYGKQLTQEMLDQPEVQKDILEWVVLVRNGASEPRSEGQRPGRVTEGSFARVADMWQDSPHFKGLSAATQKNYAAAARELVEIYGPSQVADLKRSDAQAMTVVWGDKVPTLAARHAVAQNILNYAMDTLGLIEANPWLKLKLPKHKAQGRRPWTEAEQKAVLAEVTGWMELALLMARLTGMRRVDIVQARWDMLGPKGLKFTQQKTGETIVIPIHPLLQERLDREPRRGPHIVTDDNGKPIRKDRLTETIKAIRTKLGLADDLHFHGLRATAVVWLLEAGCTDKEVMAITGHRSQSALEVYAQHRRQETLGEHAMAKAVKHTPPASGNTKGEGQKND